MTGTNERRTAVPTIYQAQCGSCGFKSSVFPAGYGAIFQENPSPQRISTVVAGAVLFGEGSPGPIANQGDARFIVLAHPAESSILKEAGYSWGTLLWAGRYVHIRHVVCTACGWPFEVRRLTSPPAAGCLVGLLAGLIVGTAFGVWARGVFAGFLLGYAAAMGSWAAAGLLAWLYTRLRFKREHPKLMGQPVARNAR